MKLRKTIAIALIAASISPVAYAKDATYMEEGSSVVIMNGNEKDIEKNVINVDGTAYVPLRALSDVLGKTEKLLSVSRVKKNFLK